MNAGRSRPWKIAAVAFVAALVVAGCESPKTASLPTAATRGNPLDVLVTLDPSSVAAQSIGSAGAVLIVSAANGTKFTLDVPQHALAADVTVTMTPVSSIGGLPLKGGLGGAVQFEPEGLQLLLPATLTIEPARSIPFAEQLGFGYSGQGKDFHLMPLAPRGDKIQLFVTHFSGDGVGQGTASDVAGVTPGTAEGRYQQQVAEISANARSDPNSTPADFVAKVAALDAAYRAQLQAGMKQGCDAAAEAIAQSISLSREQALRGDESGGEATLSSLLESQEVKDASAGCADEWKKRLEDACAAGDTSWMKWAQAGVIASQRQAILIGNGGGADSLAGLIDMKCAPKGWTGSITATKEETDSLSDGITTSGTTETLTQTVTVTKTVRSQSYGQDFDFEMEGAISGHYDFTRATSYHPDPAKCLGSGESTETMTGSGGGKARIVIVGDAHQVGVSVISEATLEAAGTNVATGTTPDSHTQECRLVGYGDSRDVSTTIPLGGIGFRDDLSGDDIAGKSTLKDGTITWTIEWRLTREK
ncbi:MAG: hypothetical protein AUH85_02855 [Chloroflexi bacterium 13_1_40CM_4_68_4]|nr:MAG: hypothetical protein AUH85_02855 [Chloroflexi bacterium 13_1_40CM_4_68_4]